MVLRGDSRCQAPAATPTTGPGSDRSDCAVRLDASRAAGAGWGTGRTRACVTRGSPGRGRQVVVAAIAAIGTAARLVVGAPDSGESRRWRPASVVAGRICLVGPAAEHARRSPVDAGRHDGCMAERDGARDPRRRASLALVAFSSGRLLGCAVFGRPPRLGSRCHQSVSDRGWWLALAAHR